MAGERGNAKRYADQGVKLLNQMSSAQLGKLQAEVRNLTDVQYSEYSPPSPQGGERKEQQQ